MRLKITFVIAAVLIWLSQAGPLFAEDQPLELKIDAAGAIAPLPPLLQPSIDLSGRGFHRINFWPQTLASNEVLDTWAREIGFPGVYRIQYNLWEISELANDKDSQAKLLENYESVIKRISDAGGTVMLDLFSTPAGMGKVLSRKSAPVELRPFKQLVKNYIRHLSCEKGYRIWYEVWSAPDLDEFFLGRKQEYLNLYRAVAEVVKELEQETKIHIPVGGPSVSWWFQDPDGNTVVTPERGLIYDLIRFCYNYRLPLDFISWHAYSTDPEVEKEVTRYNKKTSIALVRDWLSYFRFNRNTPLIVSEWNYDSGANVLPERGERSNISASYLVSRLRNMLDAGLDYQVFFSLEDFRSVKENVIRNVGLFWFDPEYSEYKGAPKATYNVFRMLAALKSGLLVSTLPPGEAFVGSIATKNDDQISLLVYNYVDPRPGMDYLSRNVSGLNDAARKFLVNFAKSGQLEGLITQKGKLESARIYWPLKNALKKAREFQEQAVKYFSVDRAMNLTIKNLTGNFVLRKYAIDSSCGLGCAFVPVEEKDISAEGIYREALTLKPYSVQLLTFSKKPVEPTLAPPAAAPEPEPEVTPAQNNEAKPPAEVPGQNIKPAAEQEQEKIPAK